MNGRTEHRIKVERNINNILVELPDYVTSYYYNISSGLEPKTCAEYIRKIRKFLEFINADPKAVDVRTLTNTDVARYLHSIEIKTDRHGKQTETSFSYRNMVYSILKSFFDYLVANRMIDHDPMVTIKRSKNADNIKRVYLTQDDFNKILMAVDEGAGSRRAIVRQRDWQSRDKAIFTMFMMTGMRETALTEINVQDVNLIERTIIVIDKRHMEHVYIIGSKLLTALKSWMFDRSCLMLKTDALFVSNEKKRISVSSVVNIVAKYTQEALGYSISPHKIRAAFCTILYNQTGDIEFVREAVGHRNISTTQRYIVKNSSARQKSIAIMDSLI